MESGMESIKNSGLWGLESKLEHVLKPVTPDPVFVDALKLKLTRTPAIVLETGRKHVELVVIGVGLAAGVLAFWIYHKLTNKS